MTEPLTEHDELSELRTENARLERALASSRACVDRQAVFNAELWEDLNKVRRATLWQHVVLWWRSM